MRAVLLYLISPKMEAYNSEAHLQAAVIRYIKIKYPEIRYCASLGGQYQKHISQRAKAQSTGYVRGFPDLQICEARGGYFGLFIEIKLDKRCYASGYQKDWLNDLNNRGYLGVVAKGYNSVISTIDQYFEQEQTKTREQAT